MGHVTRFIVGHATHPDWRGRAGAGRRRRSTRSTRRQRRPSASLGFVYFTDHYAPQAEALYEALHARWPGVAWVGTVGVGVCASGVEYFDEPALVLMLADAAARAVSRLLRRAPLSRIEPERRWCMPTAPRPTWPSCSATWPARTSSGYLFGGLAASRTRSCQIADGVCEGGLSGVAFTRDVALVSRVTQGCQPVGPRRRITAAERNVVTDSTAGRRCNACWPTWS